MKNNIILLTIFMIFCFTLGFLIFPSEKKNNPVLADMSKIKTPNRTENNFPGLAQIFSDNMAANNEKK